MGNRTMQGAKVVAWNRRVHVMLGVVVHVPVEKLNHRVDRERPAAEPEIRHVVLQSYVLGVIAEEEEPASVEREKACQNRYEPPAEHQRNHRNSDVPSEEHARPVHNGTSHVRIVPENVTLSGE